MRQFGTSGTDELKFNFPLGLDFTVWKFLQISIKKLLKWVPSLSASPAFRPLWYLGNGVCTILNFQVASTQESKYHAIAKRQFLKTTFETKLLVIDKSYISNRNIKISFFIFVKPCLERGLSRRPWWLKKLNQYPEAVEILLI